MWRVLILILAAVVLEPALACAAQGELAGELGSRNLLCLLLGVTSTKEENLHAKVHSAPSLNLEYRHLWLQKNLQEVSVSGLCCRPKTGLEDLNSSVLLQADFAYGSGFPAYRSGMSSLFFGPTVRLRYSVCYYPNWDESHLYWGNYLALGGKVHFIRGIRKSRRLVVSAGVPLVAAYTRPDLDRLYKYDDMSLGGVLKSLNEDMRLGWWSNVLYLDLRAGYEFSITPRVQHTVLYSLGYARVKGSEGDPLQILTHSVGLEVSW